MLDDKEICRECGLCEYLVLAKRRDEAKIFLDWVIALLLDYIQREKFRCTK